MTKKRRPKPLLIIIVTILIIILTGLITFNIMVSPTDKSSKADIEVVIPTGTNTRNIGKILKEKHLIRSEIFFKVYVKLNNITSLKASTYTLKKNMTLNEIITVLEKGNSYNPDAIKLTFKEGKRITDYISTIASNTNHTEEEILAQFNNKDYIKELTKKYWFLTEEILDPNIYYPLEGYLHPDTYYFKNKDVDIKTIIETMLSETEEILSKYKNTVGQNINKYIIMASMIEIEGTNTTNRKMIAGIFNNRLAKKMNLGADATTYYALQQPMTSDLTVAEFNTDSPYNTRSSSMAGKMPIGAICNPSISSIEASINPTESDYLYFVADKNGEIFYTKTLQEHNKKVKEIKEKGDWIW